MSDTPTIRVLSLGAGRQSTTIALLSAEGALPKLDAAIFADTGWEPKGVYDHLDRLEHEVLKPAGIPLYRVSNGNLRDDVLNPNKMRSIPAHTADPATGDHGMLNRRCTQIYKLNPILAQVRLLLGAKVGEARPCKHCDGTGERIAPWRAKLNDFVSGPCSVCDGEGTLSRIGPAPNGVWAEQWIGFSTDEIQRVSNRGDTRYSKSRYPLLELDMSVTQCIAYLKARGWEQVVKSACIGCPYHGNAAWRKMRDADPDSWKDAVDFDHEYRRGPGMRHERFLHITRKPLDLAPIDRIQPREYLQPSLLDASIELDLERLENGDPDGCSPWACRSGEAVS